MIKNRTIFTGDNLDILQGFMKIAMQKKPTIRLMLHIFIILFLSCSLASADNFLFKVGENAEDIKVSGSLEDESGLEKVGSGIKNDEVQELLEKNKELYAPDKWEGYLEFTGRPGTTRDLGVSDLLVPLLQDNNDMLFLNVRGQLEFDSDANEYNIGIGHRHQFDKFILGAYGFYDKSESDEGFKYDQWTVGMEVLSEKWDVRANGYIADENENEYGHRTSGSSDAKLEVDEENVWILFEGSKSHSTQKSLSGFDGEVGYKLPVFDDTRIYAGGYHFFGEDGFNSISGPRVRLETRLYDIPYMGNGSRIMVGLESQYDDPRGSQTSGLLSLRIPFGVASKSSKPKLEGLDRRMMEPVVRDIDIVTTENHFSEDTSIKSEALNPEDLPYTKVMRFDTETSMEEIIAAVKTETGKDELPLVIIEKSILEGKGRIQIGDIKLAGDATYAMAGKLLKVGYKHEFFGDEIRKIGFTPAGDTPVLFAQAGKGRGNILLKMEPGTHINGWDIDADGYGYGIFLNEAGGYFATNSTVKNAGKVAKGIVGGYTARGSGVIFYISDSESFNNKHGFLADQGASMVLENVKGYNSRFAGVDFKGGGELTIKNSSFFGNATVGLWLGGNGSGIVNVSGSEFYNNLRGIDLTEMGFAKFTNNKIYNNKTGVAVWRSDAIFENSEIFDNNNGFYIVSNDPTIPPPIEVTLNNVTITGNGDAVGVFGDAVLNINNSDVDGNCLYGKTVYKETGGSTTGAGKIIIDGEVFVGPSGGPCP